MLIEFANCMFFHKVSQIKTHWFNQQNYCDYKLAVRDIKFLKSRLKGLSK